MTLAGASGVRHFWVETVLATVLTLSVVTAAYATTVLSPSVSRPPPPAPAAPAVEAPPVSPPPAYTFGEPVPGYGVNSPFGLRRMPWENHGRLHEGVDIAAPVGKPVTAVADGVITRAGTSASYGRFVEVQHGEGLTSFYAHLGRIDSSARSGVAVKAGTTIGKIGSSGTSTGPHLHFEIRRKDRPLNPVAFMGRQFATVEDLPITSAARYSRRVRVAQVSVIPESKKALMEVEAAAGKPVQTEEGRVRATLPVAAAD